MKEDIGIQVTSLANHLSVVTLLNHFWLRSLLRFTLYIQWLRTV